MIEPLMFIQQVLFSSIFIAIYGIKICKVAKTCFVGFPFFKWIWKLKSVDNKVISLSVYWFRIECDSDACMSVTYLFIFSIQRRKFDLNLLWKLFYTEKFTHEKIQLINFFYPYKKVIAFFFLKNYVGLF